MTDVHQLAEVLHAAGALPAAWRSTLLAVPRERFIPLRVWVSDESNNDVALDRSVDPERWMAAVYANTVLVTQFDDGTTAWPTVGRRSSCSASMPSAVLGMLDVLDVHEGMKVLEIGTGTGFNAALLAERLGGGQVTTIEVDPVLAEQARATLVASGHEPVVICGDGAAGFPEAAPFDRVLATATVRLGELPYAWIEQTRPGGIIVAPMRTELTSGPLVRFTVSEDGTATGEPVPLYVGFMELRAQRSPLSTLAGLRWDDPYADTGNTEVEPWKVFNNLDQRWAVGVRVRQCRWQHWPPTENRPHVLWLSDPTSQSWATAAYGRDPGPYTVRQTGPRRLWDEAETAYQEWLDLGSPTLEQWQFTVTPDQQTAELA